MGKDCVINAIVFNEAYSPRKTIGPQFWFSSLEYHIANKVKNNSHYNGFETIVTEMVRL